MIFIINIDIICILEYIRVFLYNNCDIRIITILIHTRIICSLIAAIYDLQNIDTQTPYFLKN